MTCADLCIVVLNFNRAADTIACLESLVRSNIAGASVIVVDNASTDDSYTVLRRWVGGEDALSSRHSYLLNQHGSLNIFLINSGANGGYAQGNNVGIRFAQEMVSSAQYYLVLNNDAVVQPGAVLALMTYVRSRPRLGLCGVTVVEHHDERRIQAAGGVYFNMLTSINKPYLGGDSVNSSAFHNASSGKRNFSYISGVALLIPHWTIDQVGLLPEEYFMYFEEFDYARRVKRSGLELHWCKESVVSHKGSGAGIDVSFRKSTFSELQGNSSYLIFVRRWYPHTWMLLALVRFSAKFASHLLTRRFYLLPSLVRAYVSAKRPVG